MLADDGKKTEGELKSLSERVAKLKEDLDAAKKQHEKEIEDEKHKNEVTPNSGARTSELNKQVTESLEQIVKLREENKSLRNLGNWHRYFAFCLALPYSLAHSIKPRTPQSESME